ncbi:hypothetical protein DL546_004861 [Coniochaeta pulveracea]|uniref:Signal recognition particle subunit SRP68 n=1 Tax=Coniochaeta pulveracea TaxID=177199 RepID=A0A420YD28_9PEZI|nr:hypothetical protein DL546_004861 [Coniochaeta pulveracea]
MDITKTIVSLREAALLYGDYSTYRSQLAKKLHNSRKKLGIATKKRQQFHAKAPVTPQQIAENHEYAHLQLLTAERAFAHAMAMKASHAADTNGIKGSTRSHIVSRLEKGAKAAERLAAALSESEGASKVDVLEARAYVTLLKGAEHFEKQSWAECVRNYAITRIIYSALSTPAKADIFKDLLSETIDPSIRYAAYQLKIPRTQPIQTIVLRAFDHSDTDLVDRIKAVSPSVFESGSAEVKPGLAGPVDVPSSITWRRREVKIEDADIAVAWGSVAAAKSALAEKLSSSDSLLPRDMAAAYDGVLGAAQDAVDATQHAINELKGEGVQQSDPRMQSLQITRTAVNYELISWRIGRNRVLMGERDGISTDSALLSKRQLKKTQQHTENQKEEAPGRRIARLKEKVVLYDGTLQSLESIKELPGVAADEELAAQIEATCRYFDSLKALAIARSYSIAGNDTNALALIKYAHDKTQESGPVLRGQTSPESAPRNIVVSNEDVSKLDNLLSGELLRFQALVEIAKLRAKGTGAKVAPIPLVERLSEYPSDGVDLENIVAYPPRLDAIPVKPLYLDVAFNHVDYPAKHGQPASAPKAAPAQAAVSQEEAKPQKRGWFGFGR